MIDTILDMLENNVGSCDAAAHPQGCFGAKIMLDAVKAFKESPGNFLTTLRKSAREQTNFRSWVLPIPDRLPKRIDE